MNDGQPTPMETPGHSHRTELVPLVFTEIVGSTAADPPAWCSGEVRA
jgi:hypothetical protein